jgi:hypothetical protein
MITTATLPYNASNVHGSRSIIFKVTRWDSEWAISNAKSKRFLKR